MLVDEDFHIRLALSSGNTALAEVLATVNERIRIVRVHDFLTEERILATVEEHLGIIDGLLDGTVDTHRRTARSAHRRIGPRGVRPGDDRHGPHARRPKEAMDADASMDDDPTTAVPTCPC